MPPQLTSQDQVDALIAKPGPVWLFKHSDSCGVSAAALAEVGSYLAAHPGDASGMVVVQGNRQLSSWIGTRLRYVHQSPQLFLLRDGAVVWSASHWAITAEAMAGATATA
jgi:bacillithiol system protein YtxJ